MSTSHLDHQDFGRIINNTLADPHLQKAVYTATGRLMSHRRAAIAPDLLPDYQELREQARLVKLHTIENLDWYLEQFERNVTAHGGHVHWCRNAEEVAETVLGIAKPRGVKLVVKSKSMTSEEIHLNDRLAEHGIESVETDLGEYILPLLKQRPYHIIAPALHLTRYDVADLFEEKLGTPHDTVIENQTRTARVVLREAFLRADMGISGANFLVADSGAIVVVENEGNARLSTSAPRVHVAIAGIEKVIPRARDLATFLKLLARSATGQMMSAYTSFLSGPRRAGEVDGPEEFHVILLDGGRTKLLEDEEKRTSLTCIRCGACLNHCPVYRKIGGHSFPWVYSGPIGAILTPQFHGLDAEPALPFASSLCGACAEVCPVKIDIPKILLRLRSDIKNAEKGTAEHQFERMAFRAYAYAAARPKLWRRLTKLGARFSGPGIRHGASIPVVRDWLSQRDLPAPAARSFRELWQERGA